MIENVDPDVLPGDSVVVLGDGKIMRGCRIFLGVADKFAVTFLTGGSEPNGRIIDRWSFYSVRRDRKEEVTDDDAV